MNHTRAIQTQHQWIGVASLSITIAKHHRLGDRFFFFRFSFSFSPHKYTQNKQRTLVLAQQQ